MNERWNDSRGSSRYEAVKGAVYLGWWEEPEFRTCAARLKNLSHGGALVLVGLAPPEGADLWLCRGGSAPGDWAAVTVVEAVGPRERVWQLRLAFSEACPFTLFESAVLGHEPGG